MHEVFDRMQTTKQSLYVVALESGSEMQIYDIRINIEANKQPYTLGYITKGANAWQNKLLFSCWSTHLCEFYCIGYFPYDLRRQMIRA